MISRSRKRGEPGALDLIEAASALVRRAPASTHALLLTGTVPCILATLYFWADMSRSPFAGRHLGAASLGVALAFVWMKLIQVLYCRRLHATLVNAALHPLPPLALLRIALVQAAIQPLALAALVVASVIVVPYGWVFAFGQNLSIVGSDPTLAPLELARRARRQAELWPRQNHVMGLVLTLLALVVGLNLGIALFAAPHLFKMLFGVDTAFTLGGLAALNTTFLAVVAGLTYIVCDPLIKAAYTLRCFHGESIQSGTDLRAALREERRTTHQLAPALTLLFALVAGACLLPSHAAAQSTPASIAPIDTTRLDASIRDVLERPEFAWRLPRNPDPEPEHGILGAIVDSIRKATLATMKTMFRWGKAVMEWLSDLMPSPTPSDRAGKAGSTDWELFAGLLGYLLLGLTAAVLGVALWHAAKRRRQTTLALPVTVVATPDLESESTTAAELPEAGWLELAHQLLARGELRLGVRALYLAALAHLSLRQLVEIARHKSNREYSRELSRRVADRAELLDAFAATVGLFERVWYGDHRVDPPALERVERDLARIRAHA